MDGGTPVSALLRKVLVISRKLGLSSLQLWIENELNGYKSEVPRYRKITGQLRAFNPFRGYIPVLVQDRELEQSLSERDLFDPIPEIEELYERAKDKGLVSKFDTETAMKLFPDAPNGIVPELHIDSVQFKKVLDAVRNRILEWSLQLETDGIVGDNITFTEEEKQTARGNVTNYGTIIQGDNIIGSQV